ncbi:hypothetical protein GN956_G25796 [Arapaima gigas]
MESVDIISVNLTLLLVHCIKIYCSVLKSHGLSVLQTGTTTPNTEKTDFALGEEERTPDKGALEEAWL